MLKNEPAVQLSNVLHCSTKSPNVEMRDWVLFAEFWRKKSSVAYLYYITFKIHGKSLIVLFFVSMQVSIFELYDRTDKSPCLIRDAYGCLQGANTTFKIKLHCLAVPFFVNRRLKIHASLIRSPILSYANYHWYHLTAVWKITVFEDYPRLKKGSR